MTEKIIGIRPDKKPVHPRRCETCAHFEPPENPNQDAGSCLAQYPQALMALGVGPGGAAVLTYFPQMKPEQRCSKWESQVEPLPPSLRP